MTSALQHYSDQHTTIIVDSQVSQATQLHTITSSWFDPEYWHSHNAITGQAAGRGTTTFLHWQGQDLILRRYCRGGAIRKLSEDAFVYAGFKRTRPWRELDLLHYMNQLNLPVPQGLAGSVTRDSVFYRSSLLSLRIPNARDVHEVLIREPLSDKVWQQIGRTIRQLHDAQVYHHDLNIRNIMIDQSEKIWLIDFDKCRVAKGSNWKSNNLARLARSLKKEQNLSETFYFSSSNWQHLLQGYGS